MDFWPNNDQTIWADLAELKNRNQNRTRESLKAKNSMAMAAATVATLVARPLSLTVLSRRRPKRVFYPSAYSSTSSSSSARKLVLYSKPGCCLCDGLKEKLQAAFLLSGPDSLHDVDLQVPHFSTFSLFVRNSNTWRLKEKEDILCCIEFVVLVLVRWEILQPTLSGKRLTSMRYLCWPKSFLMAPRFMFFFFLWYSVWFFVVKFRLFVILSFTMFVDFCECFKIQ